MAIQKQLLGQSTLPWGNQAPNHANQRQPTKKRKLEAAENGQKELPRPSLALRSSTKIETFLGIKDKSLPEQIGNVGDEAGDDDEDSLKVSSESAKTQKSLKPSKAMQGELLQLLAKSTGDDKAWLRQLLLNNGVEIPSTHNGPIKPFAQRERYFCPYRVARHCLHETSTYKAIQDHISRVHAREPLITTIEEDPLEDGTKKIPCQKQCGKFFSSYALANKHARKPRECSAKSDRDMLCEWNKINGCAYRTKDARAMANHDRGHRDDKFGPYACKRGCPGYWASLTLLFSHEERNKCISGPPVDPVPGADEIEQDDEDEDEDEDTPVTTISALRHRVQRCRSVLRCTLSAAIAEPNTLMIVRSSNAAPKRWKSGTGSLHDGLPIFGQLALEQFNSAVPAHAVRSLILHAGWDVMTRLLPMPEIEKALHVQYETRPKAVTHAIKFTEAVVTDMQRIEQQGKRPFLILIGLDALFCSKEMLQPWLERVPAFTMAFRVAGPQYNLSMKFFSKGGDAWWAMYESEHLLGALKGISADEKYINLIQAWDNLQGIKDTHVGNAWMMPGRNKL